MRGSSDPGKLKIFTRIQGDWSIDLSLEKRLGKMKILHILKKAVSEVLERVNVRVEMK